MHENIEWQEAFHEQIPRLRRYALALTQNKEKADDLVQDALERAWTHIDKWQTGTNLRAWLFTIMHNVYANQVRRYKTGPCWVPLDTSSTEASYTDPEPLTMRDLQTAMAQLPAEQKEVLLLAGLEQMSYAEISAVTGVPLGTVMSRLARARERLRKLMHESQQKPVLRQIK